MADKFSPGPFYTKLSQAADYIDALKAENQRLREALEVYAGEHNWTSAGFWSYSHSPKDVFLAESYGYELARQALNKKTNH